MNLDRDEILGDTVLQKRLRAEAQKFTERVSGLVHHHEYDHHGAYTARQAREWARSRWDGLQHRVEQRPYSASAWALGIGFVTGMILIGRARTRRRQDLRGEDVRREDVPREDVRREDVRREGYR